MICYVLVLIGSLVLASFPFFSRFREASLWLRIGLFLQAPIGITWSTLGFYLLLHDVGGKTTLAWSRFWALANLKSNIAGVAVGMLVSLMLSPEALRLRHKKSRIQPIDEANGPIAK
jgi:hypothetical protein